MVIGVRKYFLAWHTMLESTKELSDAELGKLFRALLQYSITHEVPNLTGHAKVMFPMFAISIDQEIQRYERACEKNRINASVKRESDGRLKANQSQTHPNTPNGTQTDPLGANGTHRQPTGRNIKREYIKKNNKYCPPAPAPVGGGAEDDDKAPYGRWVD